MWLQVDNSQNVVVYLSVILFSGWGSRWVRHAVNYDYDSIWCRSYYRRYIRN